MKCMARVPDGSHYDRLCKNKAKWLVNGDARCGVHARRDDWFVEKYGRVAIKEGAAGK